MASSQPSFNEYQLFAGLVTIYLAAAGDLDSFGADERILLDRARAHLTKPPSQIDYDEWLPLLRDAAAIFMQKFAAAARVQAPLFESPPPQPSPIEGEGEIFPPHLRTSYPQLTFQVTLPAEFYPKMWALPRELMAMNRKWVEKGEAWDPVFFGPNHLLWWEALIRRDAAIIGPAAIVRGAELVFAQFPEDPKHQAAVAKKTKKLAESAEPFGVEVRFPTLKSWYGPVWQRALAMEAGEGRDEFLLEILKAVRTEDEALFETWVGELEKINFDWGWGIGDRTKGGGQPVPGQVKGEEGRTKTFPPPLRGGGQGEGENLQSALRRGEWREANQLLRQAYDAILASNDPQKIVAGIQALRQALVQNTSSGADGGAVTVAAAALAPDVGTITSQFLIPRGDLQSFINNEFLPLFEAMMAGKYNFNRTPMALLVFGQLAPFMNQDLVARLVNAHLVTKFDDKKGHNYLFLGYALAAAVARMKAADVKVLVDTHLAKQLTSTVSNDGRDAAKAIVVAFAKMSETEIQNIITHRLFPLMNSWVNGDALKAMTVGFARMGRVRTTTLVADRLAATDEKVAKEREKTVRVMGAAFVCMKETDVQRLIADYLVTKLDDEDEDVRMAAVAAIGAGLPRLRAAEVKDIIDNQLLKRLFNDENCDDSESVAAVFEAIANGFAKMKAAYITDFMTATDCDGDSLLGTVRDIGGFKATRMATIKIIGQGFAKLGRARVKDVIWGCLLKILDEEDENAKIVAAAVQAIGQGFAKLDGVEVKKMITFHLVALLKDKDEQVVVAAVQAIGQGFAKLNEAEVKELITTHLVTLLGDTHWDAQLAVAQVLQEGCKRLSPAELEELHELAQEKIQSTDQKEKMVGMNLLGVLAGVEVQVVTVSKPALFMNPAEIKTYITDVVMPTLAGKLEHDREKALKLLKLFVPHMDGTQVQAILTSPALVKLEKGVSFFCVLELLMMGELFLKMSGAEVGAVITTRLLPSLSDSERYIRKASVEAMGRGFARLDGETVKDLLANHLVAMLADLDERVRRAVVETMVLGLARMDGAEIGTFVTNHLDAGLKDLNWYVRKTTVQAIGPSLAGLDENEIEAIIKAHLLVKLNDVNPAVKFAALEAVWESGTIVNGKSVHVLYKDRLVKELLSRRHDSRAYAMRILGKGFARMEAADVRAYVTDYLVPKLGVRNKNYFSAAVQAIGLGFDKLDVAEIKNLITHYFVKYLTRNNANLRAAAAEAMGLGFARMDPDDVAAIIRRYMVALTQDTDHRARAAKMLALGRGFARLEDENEVEWMCTWSLGNLIVALGDVFIHDEAVQALQEVCKKLTPAHRQELHALARAKFQSTDPAEKMIGMYLTGILAGVEVKIVAVSKSVSFMDPAEIKTYITDVVMPALAGMLEHDPSEAFKLLKLFVPHMDGTQVQAILTNPKLAELERKANLDGVVMQNMMMGELFLKMSGAEVKVVIKNRLVPSLSDLKWYARRVAVAAMGKGFAKLDGGEVKDLLVNHLVAMLADSDEGVRSAVVETMVLGFERMEEMEVGTFIQDHLMSLAKDRISPLEVMWQSGAKVNGQSVYELFNNLLIRMLSQRGSNQRMAAMRILGKSFARMEATDVRAYVTDYLVPNLSDSNGVVVKAAVQAIGLGFDKLDTAEIKALITDHLAKYLDHVDANIRAVAAEAMGLGFARMDQDVEDPIIWDWMVALSFTRDTDPHVYAAKMLALGRGFARLKREDKVEWLWTWFLGNLVPALGDINIHDAAVQALQEVCKKLNPAHRQELHALAQKKSQSTDFKEKMIGMYLTGILLRAEVKAVAAVSATADQTITPAQADHGLQRTPNGFAITSFTGVGNALARGLIPSFVTLPVVPRESIDEADRIYIPPARDLVLFERFRRHLDDLAALIMTDAANEDRIAIRLIGPAGTGKTTFPELLAARMGIPLFTIPFSERTDPSDLEGVYKMTVIDGQKVPVFEEGPATVAMEKGYWLALDEPDLARAGVLATTNNTTAPKRRVWVKRASGHLEQIDVHPRYRVFVTENGLQELGRKNHGKDFLRRFVPIFVRDWDEAETTQVVHELYAGKDGVRRWDYAHSQLLAKFHVDMARWAAGKFVVKDGAGKPTALPPLGSGMGQRILFTPRSILRLAQRLVKMVALTPENLSRAIRAEYILPLADPVDQELVWNQARAVLKDLVDSAVMARSASAVAISPENLIGPKAIPAPTLESISQKYLQGRPINVDDTFVWNQQALNVVDEILWNISLGIKDIFLMGPPGESKSTIPEVVAQLLGLDYYDQLVSSDMDATDLVGGPGRVNGTIGFVPGKTYLAAKYGGVNHIDEALLPDTGQMEAVFNPLMDDRKVLIVTSEPSVVARDSDMINIFTSNTDFGDSEDRNPMSGAAMSRMAVFQMVRGFAMSDADGAMILAARMERPVRIMASDRGPATRSEGEGQIFSPPLRGGDTGEGGGGRRDLAHWRHSVDGQSSATVAERYVPLPVHPQLAAKFNIPTDLFLDTMEGKIVRRGSPSPQPSPTGGEGENAGDPSEIPPPSMGGGQGEGGVRDGVVIASESEAIPLEPSELEFFNRMANYFTRRTQAEMAQVAGRIFTILYRLDGNFSTDLATKNIFINLLGLLKHSPEGGLGIGKHEYAHAIIDRSHPLYDAVEVLRLLANVVGDPRMNEYASSLRDDFHDQVNAMCSETYPKELSADEQEHFRKLLPHEQFAHAMIHAWFHGQIMPWIENAAVITALQAALPLAGPAFFLFPASLADQHVDAAAKKFYDILDSLLPIYKELLRESDKQIVNRLQAGETMEQMMNPKSTPSPQPSPPSTTLGTGAGDEGENAGNPSEIPPPLRGGGQGEGETQTEGGNLPTGDELAELLRRIKNARAGELNKAFAPGDPALNGALVARITAAKDAHGGGKIVWPAAGAAGGAIPQTPTPLTDDQRRTIERAQAEALKRGVSDNLFLQMLPAKATLAASKLKRIMPPTEPQYDDGLFMQGKRMDGKAAAQDAMDPSGTGRIMKRKTGVGKYNANFMLVSDVSGSLEMAGAVDNTLRASATVIHVAEELRMDYGEIFFGSHTIVAKPLGKRLGTYPAKNALLHSKRKKFKDEKVNGGTNIRKALREAIDAIKSNKAKSNFIVLVTDGAETDKTHSQTLAELRREAAREGIHLLVIALGDAKKHVPGMFYDAGEDQTIASLNYRFAANNGADIPDILLEMIEECHKGRLPADRQYPGSKVKNLTSQQATVDSRDNGRTLVSWCRVPSETIEPREGALATKQSTLVSSGKNLVRGGEVLIGQAEGEINSSPPLMGGDQGEGGVQDVAVIASASEAIPLDDAGTLDSTSLADAANPIGTFDHGPIHSVLTNTSHAAVHRARAILLGK